MMRSAFLAFVLAGCAVPPTPAPAIPARLMVCDDPVPTPSPPKPPRTGEQILRWQSALSAASTANAARLRDCRARLDDRNAWKPSP